MNKVSTKKKSGTDWKRLRTMKDEEIDFSDTPPIDRAMFNKMVIRMPEKKAAYNREWTPVAGNAIYETLIVTDLTD